MPIRFTEDTNVVPKSVQADRDSEARRIIQSEFDKETDPDAKAGLGRELARLGGTPTTAKKTIRFTPDNDQPTTATDKAAPPSIVKPITDTQAAAYGVTRGAGLGLAKYPIAGIAMAADYVRNPNARDHLGWKQALGYMEQGTDEARNEHPASFYSGEVGGALATAPMSGGGSMASLAGRGAVSGAVQGYTGKEDLGDAGIGAGIGGTLGMLARPITKAGEYLTNKVAKTAAIKAAASAKAEIDYAAKNGPDALAALKASGGAPPKATLTDAEVKAATDLVDSAPLEGKTELIKQYIANKTQSAGERVAENLKNGVSSVGKIVKDSVTTLPGLVTLGTDILSTGGAMTAGRVLGQKSKTIASAIGNAKYGAQNAVAANPQVVNNLANTAVRTGAVVGGLATDPAPTDEPQGAPQPVLPTQTVVKPRLAQLADEMREKQARRADPMNRGPYKYSGWTPEQMAAKFGSGNEWLNAIRNDRDLQRWDAENNQPNY